MIVLIYSIFNRLAGQKMNESVFTMDDLLAYEDELVEEDYARIPANNSKNSAMIIFDEKGKIQYASNRTIGEKVFFQDLDMINDYGSDQFFEVFQNDTPDGLVQYYVYLNVYDLDLDMDGETMVPQTVDYCVLDEDYRILEGGLFPERTTLTQREFELLSGISSTNSMLEKYVYYNEYGEKRILAFLSSSMTQEQYNAILQSVRRIWFIGIFCVFLAIILFTVLFFYKIKHRISPLNQTIVSYEKGKTAEISPDDVPSEFHEVVRNFKNLLNKLEQTREEKENLYQERQKLIADVSHDLKTPLTVIQGYAKALSENRVPPEKQSAYMDAIFNKSRQATDMVNDLFMFTQIEHPDYPLRLETTNFSEFVKSFFAEKYTELTDGGFELHVDIDDKPVLLPLDRKLMRRLLENLLNNAMKYNAQGTTIFVSIRERENHVSMTFADDGVGIPEEIAHTLFQPFVTGNIARTTGKGTGLGLSIAQRIVEMHHGKLSLILPPHAPYHTEFCLSIPIENNL